MIMLIQLRLTMMESQRSQIDPLNHPSQAKVHYVKALYMMRVPQLVFEINFNCVCKIKRYCSYHCLSHKIGSVFIADK